MRALYEYLDEEFTLTDKYEILNILETYNLFSTIEKSILLLKDKHGEPLDIGVISSSMVIGFNSNIKASEHDKRKKIELLVADLIFTIFIDFLRNKPSEYELIIKEIKRHSYTTCDLMGYEFNAFKKLIDVCTASSIGGGIGNIPRIASPSPKASKTRFIWTGKGRLEELVHQLATRKLIKNKGTFFDLFQKNEAELIIVKWDFERKGHLAHLLYELYKKDMIDITSNKGYFAHAEKHFISFDGSSLKANSLKKLSSFIHKHPQRYTKIIRDIDEIMDRTALSH